MGLRQVSRDSFSGWKMLRECEKIEENVLGIGNRIAGLYGQT